MKKGFYFLKPFNLLDCERRDSNPQAKEALDPKSSAFTNSATLARLFSGLTPTVSKDAPKHVSTIEKSLSSRLILKT